MPWLNYIQSHGRVHALGHSIGDYFPPYYGLLALSSYLPISYLSKIKIVSFVFDLFAAFWASQIVRLVNREDSARFRSVPAIPMALIVLSLPSLFLDSAVWGQCDSIYSSMLLGSLYCVMRGMPIFACVFFGLAMSFKMQAVFFVPVLLLCLVRKRILWWHTLFAPAAWLLTMTPYLYMGGTLQAIVDTMKKQGRLFPWPALNVANPWEFIMYFHWDEFNHADSLWSKLGLVLTAAVIAWLVWVGRKRYKPGAAWMLGFAATSMIAVPYVMPRMHERYFLPAQLCLVILACCRRGFVIPAVLLELAMLLHYANYFNGLPNTLVMTALLASTGALLILLEHLRSPGGFDLGFSAQPEDGGEAATV